MRKLRLPGRSGVTLKTKRKQSSRHLKWVAEVDEVAIRLHIELLEEGPDVATGAGKTVRAIPHAGSPLRNERRKHLEAPC